MNKPKKSGKRKTRSKDSIRSDPAYQALVRKLRVIFDDAKAKGIDVGARTDLLTCRACGGYEDEGIDTGRMVMLKDRKRAKKGTEFILISHKEKSRRLKSGDLRFTIDYEFICGVCGALQTERFRKDF